MKITLKDVASYKEEVKLETEEGKKTLVYGLNGTGKTIISNFLYSKTSDNSESNDFSECYLDNPDNKKILVYNQKFIQENFHERNSQKGIFTLSKKNKEIDTDLTNLDKKKKNIEKQIDDNKKEQDNLIKLKQEKLLKASKNTAEITEKFKKDETIRNFFLKGLIKDKKKLFLYICDIDKSTTQPNNSIEGLIKKLKEISGDSKPPEELSPIKNDFHELETSKIFSQVIIGDTNNPLGEAITNKWNNSDWVKLGLKYIKEEIKSCPFCQQSIAKELIQNIKNYFDESYKQQIKELEQIKQSYFDKKNNIEDKNWWTNNQFIKNKESEFSNVFREVSLILEENLKKIDTKINKPNQKISLTNSEEVINIFNKFITEVNQEINKYNEDIVNKKNVEKKIKKSFWELMRWNYDQTISIYKNDIEELKIKINKFINLQKSFEDEIKKINQEIIDKQKQTINIQDAISKINIYLKKLGFSDFWIEPTNDQYYKIVRFSKEKENVFKTLSEGEKMIISFLYFLETCFGKESEDDIKIKKIIIIDDPISSLSHNYIFNVSELIKNKLYEEKDFEIMILTHNLYFFHEMSHNIKNNVNLFRLTKIKNKTRINKIDKKEIQNEYDSYWQTIKDYKKENVFEFLLANTMRNILECFFGFVNRSNHRDVLKKIADKYPAFVRYMNRESHYDATNISDSKDIDKEQFEIAFREVFEEEGHETHYEKMMRE